MHFEVAENEARKANSLAHTTSFRVELEATLGLVTQVIPLLNRNLGPISNSSTNLLVSCSGSRGSSERAEFSRSVRKSPKAGKRVPVFVVCPLGPRT